MTEDDGRWMESTADEIEAIIGLPSPIIELKQLDALDSGSKTLLSLSPIAGVGYLDREDTAISTLVGGTAGFTTIVDDTTIFIPLHDEAAPPKDSTGIGLVYLFPGVGEALRINGRVEWARDEGIRVQVDEIYVHCSRAIQRAGLWELPPSPIREIGNGTNTVVKHSADGLAPLDRPEVACALANSPFLMLTSFGYGGSADTSPRGDAAGFVHRLDGHTLAIPDRKGNQRADTFHNLAHDRRISLAALVPGTANVVMVSGTGTMTTDPNLLADMALTGAPPQAALVLQVASARVVATAPIDESALWDAESRRATDQIPDMNAIAAQHIALNAKKQSKGAIHVLLSVLNSIPGFIGVLTNFGLTRELAKEGYTTHPNEAAAPRRRKARIVSIRRESADMVSVYLKALDHKRWDFEPGQFFTVAVEVNGRKVRRAYSASQHPGDRLRLSVKLTPNGAASSHFHHKAKRGDVVEMTGPSGGFTPHDSSKGDVLVLIGAGSGITPLYSILSTALRRPDGPRLVLIYGSTTKRDLVFRRALDKMANKHRDRLSVTYLLTRPAPGWPHGVGRIDSGTLAAAIGEAIVNPHASFWICGPDSMMTSTRRALIALGVSETDIHEERFARNVRAGADLMQPMPVSVLRGQTSLAQITVDSTATVLDAALEAGITMKYSCTVGECGECAARLIAGKMMMDTPNCLSQAHLDDGIVLTCVGRPTEPSTIDISYKLSAGASVGTGFTTWSRSD